MKKAIILHSWFGSPESDWCPWLKKELQKKGYVVLVPTIPTFETKSPDMETAIKAILDTGFVDQNTTIIGHSLGSVLTLRIAERAKFAKGILFAGWDFNDLTPEHQSFWPNIINHSLIKKNVPEWVVPISDNDPYVTSIIAGEMAGRLGGKIIKMGMKGHFTAKDGVTQVPEILTYL